MAKPLKPKGVQPCTNCGNPTRPWYTTLEQHPGTLQRRDTGECTGCHKPNRVQRRITEEVDAQRVETTRTQLANYLTARRARLARVGRVTR